MSSAAAPELRCPDCGVRAGALGRVATCPRCRRAFLADGGVWDLRPGALEMPKAAEDSLHDEDDAPTWRRLFFHKRYWIEWCERDWLPRVVGPTTRRFLEIGGGLCYASALAKARQPDAFVVATDVSPRYLRQHARRVAEIFDAPVDVHAAADAERLPFEDGQFDAVYSQVVLYRVPDPVRALREIRRVLAPGGRYLGIERASPWALRRDHGKFARRRAARGVAERAYGYRDWQRLLHEAGLSAGALAPVPGRRVSSPWVRRLGNAVRQVYVEISFGP